MRIVQNLLIVLILLCLSPVALAFGAAWIAQAYGCVLHEGFPNPCVILGADRGEALSSAFVAGWFGMVTLPLAALLTLPLLGVIAIRLWRRRAR